MGFGHLKRFSNVNPNLIKEESHFQPWTVKSPPAEELSIEAEQEKEVVKTPLQIKYLYNYEDLFIQKKMLINVK